MPRGKSKELTVSFWLNGKQITKLTEEQKDVIAERLSRAMSTYYTAHPEEYRLLKDERDLENK